MKLDFRTKFFMTMVLTTVTVSGNLQYKIPVLSFALCVLPFALLLAEARYATCIRGMILLLIAWIPDIFLRDGAGGMGGVLMGMISGIILRMVPGAMMGYYAMVSTGMSDLVEALRRAHLPDTLIIPVSVMFRFASSVRQDCGQIRESMKMHGLNLAGSWRHPLRLLEYGSVPLLMCAVKTADDVAVSAMTRGLIPGAKRSSISETGMKLADWIWILVFIVVFGVFVWMKYGEGIS